MAQKMMDMFYTTSALVIAVICITLVAHPEYEDGLFGRIALGSLALAELSVFWDSVMSGAHYNGLLPTTVTIQGAILLFLLRHFYRFFRWHKFGAHEWRKAKK